MNRAGVLPAVFLGGSTGEWRVERLTAVTGESLPTVERLEVSTGRSSAAPAGGWALLGVTSHSRYVNAAEKALLDTASPPLGRGEASHAALIPVRKSDTWWALPQDQRRAVFEERSSHIADSMRFLPRIARRLYHARELGGPFDFLTWFEFAPQHGPAFDELLAMLRSREEWRFVEREVEIRLVR